MCQHSCPFVGTPSFASINHHLGIQSSRRDDVESLAYTLIYLLRGSLPWLSSTHPALSNDAILKLKQDTTVDELCSGIPSEFATFLQYSRSLAYTAKPDYTYLCSLLYGHTLNAFPTSQGGLVVPDSDIQSASGLTNGKRPRPSPPRHICENTSDSVVRVTARISVAPTDHQKTRRSGRDGPGSNAKTPR